MIQRIQTIYLLISTLVLTFLFFFPYAEFSNLNNEIFKLGVFGIFSDDEEIISTIPTAILLITIVAINFISIFLFKNRRLQIRLVNYVLIVLLGFIFLNLFYIYNALGLTDCKFYFTVFTIFPFISFILNFLALKAIKKDEKLVRAADRIR